MDSHPAMDSRTKVSWALSALGLVLILWGVLGFASASYGERPEDATFANRRPYNEVKRAAHEAFPLAMLRGLGGLGLLLLGGYMRAASRAEE